MEKLAMQQEKAVTPEILNEALRGSETIKDVSAKVCHLHAACYSSYISYISCFFAVNPSIGRMADVR